MRETPKTLLLALFVLLQYPSFAQPQVTLSTNTTAALTMLVFGRDHTLYYEAYNDHSDLNADGVVEASYLPSIDYDGYFHSFSCYEYRSTLQRFEPVISTTDKTCQAATHWSGDWLNYITMSRMDLLRSALYGGYRSTDTATETVLKRSHIPQDSHSWGKEYASIALNGYDIRNYTPLELPASGNRHLFANTTLRNASELIGEPLLRVAQNLPFRVWQWLSIEPPVAGNRVVDGGSRPDISSSITDYVVAVEVCKSESLREENCWQYPNGDLKPRGMLQLEAESDQTLFGLITGSYANNLAGGVLRKNIGPFSDEVDAATGQFTEFVGIVGTLDRLRTAGFGTNYTYDSNCGTIAARSIVNGECSMWGNPIGEMLYEALRYYNGFESPTATFDYTSGEDDALGLPKPDWRNPRQTCPRCRVANILIISDENISYDSDTVPGSFFSSFSGDLALNVADLGQRLWDAEVGDERQLAIGQSGSVADGAPTEKAATSFGNLRGLAPSEANREGSYYAAAVAYHARIAGVQSSSRPLPVSTFSLALKPRRPEISISSGAHTVTVTPYAKSVGGCFGINPLEGAFQPDNSVVDFYPIDVSADAGTFRAFFSATQQGGDNGVDAVVDYTYTVNTDGTITIALESVSAAACFIQHIGYLISGTADDGLYLEVRDIDTPARSDIAYFLDTPPSTDAFPMNMYPPLPISTSRTFTPAQQTRFAAESPFWYAAKFGGFNDSNNNQTPDLAMEWDVDSNGVPDNYFAVDSPLDLATQLQRALGAAASSSDTQANAIPTVAGVYQAMLILGLALIALRALKLMAGKGRLR